VLANGLGGFAMGCADGINRRRYHGMLAAATRPPVGRVLALAAMVDGLVVTERDGGIRRYGLTGFRFAGWAGRLGIAATTFMYDGVEACWTYVLPGVCEVEKRLALADGRNEAEVEYVVRCAGRAYLEVRPLVAMRDIHALVDGQRDQWRYAVQEDESGFDALVGDLRLSLRAGDGRFNLARDWWWNFEYEYDLARGQTGKEDLLCPGSFVVECEESETRWSVWAWVGENREACEDRIAGKRAAEKRDRLSRLVGEVVERLPSDAREYQEDVARLVVAADAFVVRRTPPARNNLRDRAAPSEPVLVFPTIIAGYPWFSDWGRDAMISVPGLLLIPRRRNDALELLAGFAAMRRDGLVPNCFDEITGEARYNTVDAPLWFIQACCDYLESTGDEAGFRERLLPACLDIVEAYVHGTDSISVDPRDGLVIAGDQRTNLTWMDAARDGVVFTPRHGKAVEVCGLWVSGLRRLASRLESIDARHARDLARHAERVRFEDAFWNARTGCFFDRLEERAGSWVGVDELRPNQVIALSLPRLPVSPDSARSALRAVREHLLTPVGLRTLAPGSREYRGRYEGNLFDRDAAYHNGTAWPYLLGPYVRAVLRFEKNGREEARRVLGSILGHLAGQGGTIGSIAEVYDGDEPHRADGCAAQAWNVSEVLRALWLMVGGNRLESE
jgi:predicted glycogen debranching enzyme